MHTNYNNDILKKKLTNLLVPNASSPFFPVAESLEQGPVKFMVLSACCLLLAFALVLASEITLANIVRYLKELFVITKTV